MSIRAMRFSLRDRYGALGLDRGGGDFFGRRTDKNQGQAQASRSVRCSPTRMAFAMAVNAGFTAPMLGKKLVSTT
jgi:hypothetical protein